MIEEILNAVSFQQLEAAGHTFKSLLKAVHPDLNKDPRANDAAEKLVKLHNFGKNGDSFVDDSGIYKCNYFWAAYEGDKNVIEAGRKSQIQIAKGASLQLSRYMPYEWISDNQIKFLDRALPLSGLVLHQDHVNWIVSRLIEFCMLLHKRTGQIHMGLTPDNIFVVPETHGVSVAGFYHSKPDGGKVTTISAKYKGWYPASMFKDKIARESIDLQMVKKIAAVLLGDKSGTGTSLRRTHNKDYVDFILSSDTDSKECFKRYRDMIEKNFAKQFIPLNI